MIRLIASLWETVALMKHENRIFTVRLKALWRLRRKQKVFQHLECCWTELRILVTLICPTWNWRRALALSFLYIRHTRRRRDRRQSWKDETWGYKQSFVCYFCADLVFSHLKLVDIYTFFPMNFCYSIITQTFADGLVCHFHWVLISPQFCSLCFGSYCKWQFLFFVEI